MRYSNDDMTRREFLKKAGAAAAGVGLMGLGMSEASCKPAKRPNIIFILTDDQRWDFMSCMGHPYISTPNMDRLAREGARFSNTFVTTSLCSPSRASFLTGKYAHSHGVYDNRNEFDAAQNKTFPQLLQTAGYETAFFGKWHMGGQKEMQPGFNRWAALQGQGTYMDPKLNIDGEWTENTGYVTDILNKMALDWMKQKRDAPFCMYLSHKAAHDPRQPAVRHSKLYADGIYTPAASTEDTMEGKPKWLRDKQGPMTAANHEKRYAGMQEGVRKYCRTLASVDEGIGRILDALKESGELENTIVIFAGDNGYFFGEHGLGDKRKAYDEALRIPFLVRFPEKVQAGRVIDQMCLNIDLAPTLLDLAGVSIPTNMQGRSFKPLLEGKKPKWREDFLYEYFVDREFPENTPKIQAVRTERWKYITYPDIDDITELYDLKNDPLEMKNLAADPKHAKVVAEMKVRLARLLKET